MSRLLLLTLLVLLCAPAHAIADAFDRYTNPVLAKIPNAPGVREVKKLTAEMLADQDAVLPGISGALVVFKTNDGRYSKLIVQAARQRTGADTSVPVLLLDRFVTYRPGQDRAIEASGQNVRLFDGFRFSLDIGQVVPPSLPADLLFKSDGKETFVEPVGRAVLYLVMQPIADAGGTKSAKLAVGEAFEPRYFNGTFKLRVDGRRSGTLTLQVADNGNVTGSFYSDKDGRKYEVEGKIGTPRNSIQFTIRFPRSEEVFHGWMFTGDAGALAGHSRLQQHESGFYAVRVDTD
jgi:hypothetical protein